MRILDRLICWDLEITMRGEPRSSQQCKQKNTYKKTSSKSEKWERERENKRVEMVGKERGSSYKVTVGE